MKRLLSLLVLLTGMVWCTMADETITVTANSEDISQALDLKAVATLFGTVKNVEEFETLLNNPDSAFTNLDLNGDGLVDYLRVVETSDGNRHLVVIQAVLATDIFQDVASIYVEKDEVTGQVTTQVIGDEYVYGTNYIIEPVYIYRPYIYDWFWDPFWTCWYSPYYWDFYPHWWHHWHCWSYDRYWHHCYSWHHHHPYCSFRYASHPRPHYHDMHHGVSHSEYAQKHHDRSFATRNAGHANARTITSQRAASSRSFAGGAAPSRQGSVAATRVGAAPSGAPRRSGDNTFGSTAVRSTAHASSTRQAVSSQRSGQSVQRSSSAAPQQRSGQQVHRSSSSSGQPAQRSTTTVATTRTSQPAPRSTTTVQRSQPSTQRSTNSVSRTSASTSRSSASTSRSSAPARSSSSSSGYSSSRSSSSSSSSRSSGGYSGSSSSRSGGGYSGGSHSGGGGYSGGGHSGGGGGRSGGGAPRR